MIRIFLATLIAMSSFVFQIDFYFAGMMTLVTMMLILFMPEKIDALQFAIRGLLPIAGMLFVIYLSSTFLPVSLHISMILGCFTLLICLDRALVTATKRKFEFYALLLVLAAQLFYFDDKFPDGRHVLPVLGFIASLWILITHIYHPQAKTELSSRIYSINLYISGLFHTIFVMIYMTYGLRLNDRLEALGEDSSPYCELSLAFCDKYDAVINGTYFIDHWSQMIFEHYVWSLLFQTIVTFTLSTYIVLRHQRLGATT